MRLRVAVLASVMMAAGAPAAAASWQPQTLAASAGDARFSGDTETLGGVDGTDVVLHANDSSSDVFVRAPTAAAFSATSTSAPIRDAQGAALDAHGNLTLSGPTPSGDATTTFVYRDAAGTTSTQIIQAGGYSDVAVRPDGAAYAVWEVGSQSGKVFTSDYYGAWRPPGAKTFDVAHPQHIFTFSESKKLGDDIGLRATLGADGDVLVVASQHASDCGFSTSCPAEQFVSAFTPPSFTADGGPVDGTWERTDLTTTSYLDDVAVSTNGSLVVTWNERGTDFGCQTSDTAKWGLWRPGTHALTTGTLGANLEDYSAAIDPVTGTAAIGAYDHLNPDPKSGCPADGPFSLALASGSSASFGAAAQQPLGTQSTRGQRFPVTALGNDVLLQIFGLTHTPGRAASLHALLGGTDTVLAPDGTIFDRQSAAVDGLGRAVVAWLQSSGTEYSSPASLQVATNDENRPGLPSATTPPATTPALPATPAATPIAAPEPEPPAPTPAPAPEPMLSTSSSGLVDPATGFNAVDLAQRAFCAAGVGSCHFTETASTDVAASESGSSRALAPARARSRVKTITLGRLTFVVAPGKAKKVKLHLKLPLTVRRALKHGHRVKVRLKTTLKTNAGTSTTVRYVTLRAGKTKPARRKSSH